MRPPYRVRLSLFLIFVLMGIHAAGYALMDGMANRDLRMVRAQVAAWEIREHASFSTHSQVNYEDREYTTFRWEVGGQSYERGYFTSRGNGRWRWAYYNVDFPGQLTFRKREEFLPLGAVCGAAALAGLLWSYPAFAACRRCLRRGHAAVLLAGYTLLLCVFLLCGWHLSLSGWVRLHAVVDMLVGILVTVFLFFYSLWAARAAARRADSSISTAGEGVPDEAAP